MTGIFLSRTTITFILIPNSISRPKPSMPTECYRNFVPVGLWKYGAFLFAKIDLMEREN